jgi:hypothetical protein
MPPVMSRQLDLDVDLLPSSIGSLVKGVTRPIVVVSVAGKNAASATGFPVGFYIETLVIPFYPLLAGDPVARSGRFEEAVCLYGRRDGEEGKQECRQTDRDGHDVRFVL